MQKTGLSRLLEKRFGQVELVDDLVDHWDAGTHIAERDALLAQLVVRAWEGCVGGRGWVGWGAAGGEVRGEDHFQRCQGKDVQGFGPWGLPVWGQANCMDEQAAGRGACGSWALISLRGCACCLRPMPPLVPAAVPCQAPRRASLHPSGRRSRGRLRPAVHAPQRGFSGPPGAAT
jgi:hypothetical protein